MSNQKIVTETALSALASDIKNALSGKANSNDVYLKSQTYNRTEIDNALGLKADKSELYNVYPTDQESGAITHFTDGADNIPVKSLVSQIVAIESGNGEKSPENPYTISGFDSGIITVTDNDQITNTYTFSFGQTVYGGHFNNKGNLVVTHGYVEITGSENLYLDTAPNVVALSGIPIPISQVDTSLLEPMSNYATYSTQGTGNFNNNEYGLRTSGIVYYKNTSCTTLSDFQTFFANHHLQICYKLANPIVLPITSQDIPTLLGENNIYSNCGDVEVDYHADIGLYIDKKISSLAQA